MMPPNPLSESDNESVGDGYAAWQLAKALKALDASPDETAHTQAARRVAKWEQVLRGKLDASLLHGSRAPRQGTPVWATLEVVTGGFATGGLCAGGPLLEHENALLANIPEALHGSGRLALNRWFLTEAGWGQLQEWLDTGAYHVRHPEEAALLTVAWLTGNNQGDAAHAILEEIAPWFDQLRFYPEPASTPSRSAVEFSFQDVKSTITKLLAVRPHRAILAQREAVQVWAPFYDQMMGLLQETVVEDWPCRHYPAGWTDRVHTLLQAYPSLRRNNTHCGRPDDAGGSFAQARHFLERCSTVPEQLTGKEVGRLRLLLKRYVTKHGLPNSETVRQQRERQTLDVSAPLYHDLAKIVAERLGPYATDDGMEDISSLKLPATPAEASQHDIPPGTEIPVPVQRRLARCEINTLDSFVQQGLISSADMLAEYLPRFTAELQAAEMTSPSLRRLYSSLYRAFRKRRSLLLLNFQHQVQLDELPWAASLGSNRTSSFSEPSARHQPMRELAALTISFFPHTILPNKLLKEFSALARTAGLDLPVVEEVAADIFMGDFTHKYLQAAKIAAFLLKGTLYEAYYDIDYAAVLSISDAKPSLMSRWLRRNAVTNDGTFASLCYARAGNSSASHSVAANGVVIEQQQILTTQNLAVLFSRLDLMNVLVEKLPQLARQSFTWICQRQQMKISHHHAGLIMLKNTAYAWRQMLFYLALISPDELKSFSAWMDETMTHQSDEFQKRFHPVVAGFKHVVEGGRLNSNPHDGPATGAPRVFLGWSATPHWLMPTTAAKKA